MTIFTVILPHIYPFPCNKSIWNILQGRRVISHSFFTDLLSFKMIRNKLQKRRIYLNSFNAHFLCFKMVRVMVKCTGMVCIILLRFSCIQRWSGTLNIMHSLLHSASLHISWVLKRSGTYANESGFMGTALLHISCVFKVPWDLSYPTWNIFKRHNFIHTLRPRRGSNFMILFNHFHNPHFHGLVHRQSLTCSPYVQPLKQAQENYQTYTLKDNLS